MAAVRFLVLSHNQTHGNHHGIHWKNVAVFLRRTRSLNQLDVGTFLALDGDEIFSSRDMRELRRAYVDLLDFSGLSFERALHVFASDCGLIIPNDRPSYERLMESFANGYHRDNRHVFDSAGPAQTLAIAILELSDQIYASDIMQEPVVKSNRDKPIGGNVERQDSSPMLIGEETLTKNEALVSTWRAHFLCRMAESPDAAGMPGEDDLLVLFQSMLRQPLQWRAEHIPKDRMQTKTNEAMLMRETEIAV